MGYHRGRQLHGHRYPRPGPGIGLNKGRRFGLLLLLVLLSGIAHARVPAGGAGPGPASQPQYTDRLIVQLKPVAAAAGVETVQVDSLQGLSVAAGTTLRRVHSLADGRQILALPHRLTLPEVEDIAQRLGDDPQVQYAEPDRVVYPSAVPDDPDYSLQWHYKGPAQGEPGGADLPGAWDITRGDPAIVIAVLDTGILPHKDLAGRTLAGYDFVSDPRTANDGDGRDPDPTDPGDWITPDESAGTDATGGYFSGCAVTDSTWHGTHVAGTLAAVTNNNLGGAGVNWTSKLLPVRVLGKCGGYTSDIVAAIRWAAGLPVAGVPDNTHPAQVINLSLSGAGPCSQAEQQAIDDATAAGATIVVAAGNDDKDASGYHPGNCNGVITVGAGNRAGGEASYSNFGATVAITAPGGDASGIYSTLDRGTRGPLNDSSYGYYVGTSMATAHVAGTVSLMLSANYGLTHTVLSPTTVLAKLQATARRFPTGTGADCDPSRCGSGLLDGAGAVSAVATPPTVNAGADQVVKVGARVALSGSASAALDGGIAKYSWSQIAGTPVTITNSDSAVAAFVAPGSPAVLTFEFTATNDVGVAASDTVVVTVTGGGNAPLARDQQIGLDEDTGYAGTLSASGASGLTYTLLTNGDKGRAVITDAATGAFTYTPFANTSGRDSFTFLVGDGTVTSNIATVSVTIRPVNDPPVANAATFTAAPGGSYQGRLAAGDVDGDPLTYSVVTPPAHGTVALTAATGAFTYTAAAGAVGHDGFSYRVWDGSAYSDTAAVTINIDRVADNPRLISHGVNGLVMAQGATVRVPFDAVDPDAATGGDRDTYSTTAASLGQAAFSDNLLTYTAASPGTELLTVTVRDASGNTDAEVLPVTVNPPNMVDSNHDGLSDAQAAAMGLDPQAVGGDTDGDGVGDALEAGNPLAPTDRDGDHVIDALEVGAAATDPTRLVFVVSRPTAERLGIKGLSGRVISIAAAGGATLRGDVDSASGIPLYAQATAAKGDAAYTYPLGVLQYHVLSGTPHVKVTVSLPPSAAIPVGAVIRKRDNGGRWRTPPGSVLDGQHGTVTLTLTDNDGFDSDPAAGVIGDPVGVAVALPQATGAETPSNSGAQSGGSGGGGAVGLLNGVWGLGWWYRRQRRRARRLETDAG